MITWFIVWYLIGLIPLLIISYKHGELKIIDVINVAFASVYGVIVWVIIVLAWITVKYELDKRFLNKIIWKNS